MKFKLKAGERHFEAYGHEFKPGVEIEVTEESLIKKFKKYHQIQFAGKTVEKEAQSVEIPVEKTEKDLLQEECVVAGIEYDKRWGVNKLKEALNGD